MIHKRLRRLLSVLCISAVLTAPLSSAVCNAEVEDIGYLYTSEQISQNGISAYAEYRAQFGGNSISLPEIEIKADEYIQASAEPQIFSDYEGVAGNSVVLEENGSLTYQFSVMQEGLYNLSVLYYPIEGQGSPVKMSLELDGALPFSECRGLTFERIWNDQTTEVIYDSQGNEVMPQQTETPQWRTKTACDDTGYTDGAFEFYLTQGVHTITVSGQRDRLLLNSITFSQPQKAPDYEDVLKQYSQKGYKKVADDITVSVQAEKAYAKSDQTLYPQSDRTSPTVYPYNGAKLCCNTIGGTQWKTVGQWIEWKINVPADGLYNIALHFKQALKTGNVSIRELYIDGELPFSEAADIAFEYNGAWQNEYISDDNGKPYLFYLSKGEHVLRLRAGLGRNADILKEAAEYLDELNRIYREIVVVTGANPDIYRSYNLDKLIPETLENMAALSEKLKALENKIGKTQADKNAADIKRLYVQIDQMTEDCDTVPKRLSGFKDNVSSFGTWINQNSEQPLELDSITVCSPDTELQSGEAGFLSLAKHYIIQFFWSFVTDYAAIGQTTVESNSEITVWQTAGRDQAQILRGLINSSFTPESGIAVDLQLVSANSLLSAILAGIGPDACLGVAQTEPVNLALRNAIADYSEFEGIDELLEQYNTELLESFRFNGGLYALPETMTYPMLFYRSDILEELGIELSQLETWESILQNVLPTLKKSSLSFGILPSLNNYLMFLYQRGGTLYLDNNRNSGLAQPQAIDAMSDYSMLYTQYGLSLSYDFANRFRSGEIPVAVSEFTSYNQLTVFAPEISGEWGMLPVPGTLSQDGTVDHSSPVTMTADIILARSENKAQAWEFIRWWLSCDTQSLYGKSIESVVGSAARYNSANSLAFSTVQWDADVKQNLTAQQKYLRATPEVPGGYFTTRLYDFAFRDIVYSSYEVRETMNEAAENINREMQTKREEYGLE